MLEKLIREYLYGARPQQSLRKQEEVPPAEPEEPPPIGESVPVEEQDVSSTILHLLGEINERLETIHNTLATKKILSKETRNSIVDELRNVINKIQEIINDVMQG